MTVLRLWRVVKLVSTAEIGLVDYNELTIHEEERRLWHREQERMGTVSYTHLTLPTIYSV